MYNQWIKVEKKEKRNITVMQTVVKSPWWAFSGAVNRWDIWWLITDQADLVTLFWTKQNTLVSGTNIKTINWTSILWAWDIVISGGAWDMTKATYDTTNNGIVDNSERLWWELPAYYAIATHTHTTTDITNLSSYTGLDSRYYTESEVDTLLSGKQNTLWFTAENSANKWVANGYASLDAWAKVPLSQIPSSVIGALNYQWSWNASTNTPTLSDGTGSKWLYYVVTVAGSQNLGSWAITYDAWDWVVHNGSIWERLNDWDVTTVNGQSWVVTLTKTDIWLWNVDNTSDATKNSATVTLTNKTIALWSNTISWTIAQFNTAVTDADLATLDGTETLTNKTLTSPIISTISNTGTITLPTSTDTLVGRATTDTLTNKTLTAPRIANAWFIADANGNEQIIFTTVASAVNEITISNAATWNNPTVTASGWDANVWLDYIMKWTGTFNLRWNATQAATIRLYEDTDDGSNFSAFRASPRTTDITYLMPTADPTAWQALTAWAPSSNISQLSWTTVAAWVWDHWAFATQNTGTTWAFWAYFTLGFDTETYDTDAYHDTVTNNSRFTVPSGQGGTYIVTLTVWQSSNYKWARIMKNWATALATNGVGSSTSVTGTDAWTYTVTWVGRLVATDYVEWQCYSSTNTVTTTSYTTFSIQRIA